MAAPTFDDLTAGLKKDAARRQNQSQQTGFSNLTQRIDEKTGQSGSSGSAVSMSAPAAKSAGNTMADPVARNVNTVNNRLDAAGMGANIGVQQGGTEGLRQGVEPKPEMQQAAPAQSPGALLEQMSAAPDSAAGPAGGQADQDMQGAEQPSEMDQFFDDLMGQEEEAFQGVQDLQNQQLAQQQRRQMEYAAQLGQSVGGGGFAAGQAQAQIAGMQGMREAHLQHLDRMRGLKMKQFEEKMRGKETAESRDFQREMEARQAFQNHRQQIMQMASSGQITGAEAESMLAGLSWESFSGDAPPPGPTGAQQAPAFMASGDIDDLGETVAGLGDPGLQNQYNLIRQNPKSHKWVEHFMREGEDLRTVIDKIYQLARSNSFTDDIEEMEARYDNLG